MRIAPEPVIARTAGVPRPAPAWRHGHGQRSHRSAGPAPQLRHRRGRVSDRREVRRRTGVLLQRSGFSGDLTVAETLRMWAATVTGARPVEESLAMLRLGRRGFLPKTTSAATLAQVVRAVHAGGRHADPELAADAIAAGDSPLNPREADVLELAADGAPVDEIAQRAALSPGTVRNDLSSAVTKLGAANRHDACAVARRMGWI